MAASLPCADTRLSLVVVVPDADQFSQVESSLDATALRTLMTELTTQPVTLTLPRFKIETNTNLVALLQALGMTSAFLPGVADFSGMDGARGLVITDVFHDAFIDVAENGTKAAGSTGVVLAERPPRRGYRSTRTVTSSIFCVTIPPARFCSWAGFRILARTDLARTSTSYELARGGISLP
jgi:serine protease inhibitor